MLDIQLEDVLHLKDLAHPARTQVNEVLCLLGHLLGFVLRLAIITRMVELYDAHSGALVCFHDGAGGAMTLPYISTVVLLH